MPHPRCVRIPNSHFTTECLIRSPCHSEVSNYVCAHLSPGHAEVSGGKVPAVEAVTEGARDVRVKVVSPGPQSVPHQGTQEPADGLKRKLKIVK